MKIHCGPRKMKTTLTSIGLTFGTSLLYLSKHFCNQRLKNLIIGNSLIQLPTAYHVFSVSFNRASVIMNLKDSVTNKLFTIEVLHVTNKNPWIIQRNPLQTTLDIRTGKNCVFGHFSLCALPSKWKIKTVVNTWKWSLFCLVMSIVIQGLLWEIK